MSRFHYVFTLLALFLPTQLAAQTSENYSQYSPNANSIAYSHQFDANGELQAAAPIQDQLVQLAASCTDTGCDCGDSVGCGDGVGGNGKGAGSPCATSHKDVFYNNDFSYLKDPCYHGHCLGDCLKLMPLGADARWGTLDIGGQLRLRYHHERGMGQQAGTTRFDPTTNDFLLSRVRLYSNWQVSDCVRF